MGLMIARIPDTDAHAVGNDDEAIMRAAQHDPTAFAPIYQHYVDPIYRFCFRRLGNRAVAEDATSRTFERAMAALPRYRHGSVRAWLFTIARNTITDLYRQARPTEPIAGRWDIADGQRGPEAEAIASDEAAWVYRTLNHLNPDQRAVIELRLAGLTNLEIAQVLGRSHGFVRTVTYRALHKLRDVMDAEIATTTEENSHATR